MPRPQRNIDINGTYHITARGNNKSQLFHESYDYQKYYNLLFSSKKPHPFSLHHYVLMPNHIHLLISLRGINLSKLMHRIQKGYANYYCNKYRFVGHVWQDRYKNIPIESDQQLLACGNYIEMNPVRANLVSRPEDWTWSSYGYYAVGTPNPLVDLSPLYHPEQLIEKKMRKEYRETIEKTRSF